jgi:hypothetical protein
MDWRRVATQPRVMSAVPLAVVVVAHLRKATQLAGVVRTRLHVAVLEQAILRAGHLLTQLPLAALTLQPATRFLVAHPAVVWARSAPQGGVAMSILRHACWLLSRSRSQSQSQRVIRFRVSLRPCLILQGMLARHAQV